MNQPADNSEQDEARVVPAIGEVIVGKYRVDSVVGKGGMGVVLCATHLDLGQQVAIKVLTVQEDDARRDEARARFLREGRATAALLSDHVVRVYDVGTLASGAPFMVMELLRGQDLARTLQQTGPLSIERACDCVRQAADAIASAHAIGIVHRDLKPSNLFLTQRSDGSALVKVLDFGISKNTDAEVDRATGGLTAERSVLGTPFYMSPEQVRDAKKVDVRTDIWSLGLILHELLSGSPAFEGTTLPGVCAAIAADPPAALRLKRPDVPIEVEAIVLKCLEKEPARRFQSARELLEKLTPWTGRSESGVISPLSDATIRSASLGFELAELRDGSTVSLAPDTGTLASAVFTQSGERLVGPGPAVHSKSHGTRSDAPAPAAASPAGARRKRARLVVLGGAALAVAVTLLWIARSIDGSAGKVAAAPSVPVASTPPVITQAASFSVLIDSNPGGAEVYEAGNLLGTTPLRVELEQERTFVVRKSGFEPYTILHKAEQKDAHVLAELRKLPEPAAAPVPNRGAKKPTPIKPPAPSPKPGNDIFMQR